MDTPLLSVIIPVYNVEEYVERCIKSVIKQSYTNLEIILINDGSTDQSEKKCVSFVNMDKRIRLINKTNGGLSSARNLGLEIANGDFITFIDSDDYIDQDTYYLNIEKMRTNKSISILQFPIERNGIIKAIPTNPYMISGEKEIFANWWRNDIITSSVCNKIYRKEMFYTIRFPVGQTHEDHYLIVDFSEIAQSVYLSDKGCYHYYVRDNSITTSTVTFEKSINFLVAHLKVYKKLYSYIELRKYRVIAYSRVFRKLITAKRVDPTANLYLYINELEDTTPEWKDLLFTISTLKEILWVLFVKILGVKKFLLLFSRYLNLRHIEISL